MADATEAAGAKERRAIIYLYPFVTADNQEAHEWGILPVGWKQGDELPEFMFGKGDVIGFRGSELLSKGARPGQIFEFDTELVEGKRSVFYYAKRQAPYVGFCQDTALTIYLRGKAKAFEGWKRGRKEGTKDDVYKDLEPFKAAYARLPAPARAQLLADFVHWLTH